MSKSALRDELDQLTSSVESESYTPQQRGASVVKDATSDTERLSLSETFSLVDSTDIKFKEGRDIGTLLSNVRDSIVEADNKVYQVKPVTDLCIDVNDICCQEVQLNRNTFCIRNNCTISHRNGGAPPVLISPSTIIVIKNLEKLHAFITPMGSVDYVDKNVVSEWSSQVNTLADWASLFKLSEMSDSGCASKTDLDELHNFAEKAALHKTPKKLAKTPIKVERYSSIISTKSPVIESLGLTPNNSKFAQLVNKNFAKVDT